MPNPLTAAAEKVILEWDSWMDYLNAIGVVMPYNGIAPFGHALDELRTQLKEQQ